MKKGYKIGLFLVVAVIIALIVMIMWKRHTISGFPNDNTENEIHNENIVNDNKINIDNHMNNTTVGTSQAQSTSSVTTKDTICIYENIDKKDGAISMEEKHIPMEYVGQTRSELEKLLLTDSQSILSGENIDGFESQHLELFSPEKIKILRIYDTTNIATGYYIMEVEGEIRIYELDKETLFFRTDLVLDDLPESVQQEVIDGKYVETEVQVYHFLESYSS